MERDIRRLAQLLRATGQTVATAESCTGGWIAKTLTDLPGSSHWFLAGWVCYSNSAKHRDLGVPLALLRRHGAVSESVVRELARGALRRSGAQHSVAVSGIAGPGGAVPGKPVGAVWFAFAKRRVAAWPSRRSSSASAAGATRCVARPSSSRCAVYTVVLPERPCISRERDMK